MVSGLYVLFCLIFLLIIENKSSKHGYQRKIIIKYGEMAKLFDEKLIKKVPIKIEIKYAPESPIYIPIEILSINNTSKTSYCKKISIVSDCPNGPAEFLSFGKGGYLFKNNDIDDLIDKIYSFLKDDEYTKKKKILLSQKNSKNYTIFNHYKKINQLLHLS